jgi:hypothetical protein
MTTAMTDMELWKAALEALQIDLDIEREKIEATKVNLANMGKVVNHEN